VASSFNCRVLPVLTARLKLPTGPEGSLPAGSSTVTVNVGRVQHAAASALKSVKLQVRFAGREWTTVKLTATKAGQYTGTLNNTSFTGRTADLLLQATDKGGSSFEQTTLRAYVVAGNRAHPSCDAVPLKGHWACMSNWKRLQPVSPTRISAAGKSSTAAVGAKVPKPKDGLTPADIRSAYKLPATGGKGFTIGIVDAYDNPRAESDLKVYRSASSCRPAPPPTSASAR
jgi:hypothetical protein